jgi:hypothetical protein
MDSWLQMDLCGEPSWLECCWRVLELRACRAHQPETRDFPGTDNLPHLPKQDCEEWSLREIKGRWGGERTPAFPGKVHNFLKTSHFPKHHLSPEAQPTCHHSVHNYNVFIQCFSPAPVGSSMRRPSLFPAQ